MAECIAKLLKDFHCLILALQLLSFQKRLSGEETLLIVGSCLAEGIKLVHKLKILVIKKNIFTAIWWKGLELI